MATARAVLRECYNVAANLADIIADTNRRLMEDFKATSRFMTLFALELDPVGKSLRWVRAGHNPAVIYCPRKDEFTQLTGPGMALGILKEWEFVESKIAGLIPGCVIALGTDGIWEAHSSSGEMFGKERFKKLLKRYAREPASVILESVYDEIHRFTGGIKPEDDITLVIVKLEDADRS
jgi:sigma-B regulation protein RsbU (phosphoserine phosphatase)